MRIPPLRHSPHSRPLATEFRDTLDTRTLGHNQERPLFVLPVNICANDYTEAIRLWPGMAENYTTRPPTHNHPLLPPPRQYHRPIPPNSLIPFGTTTSSTQPGKPKTTVISLSGNTKRARPRARAQARETANNKGNTLHSHWIGRPDATDRQALL